MNNNHIFSAKILKQNENIIPLPPPPSPPHLQPTPNDYMNLFEACKNGDLKLVQTLIDKTKINLKLNNYYYYGNRKSTFLHFASGFGRKDVVQYLLSLGADPCQKDEGLVHIFLDEF
jgi:tankyrase